MPTQSYSLTNQVITNLTGPNCDEIGTAIVRVPASGNAIWLALHYYYRDHDRTDTYTLYVDPPTFLLLQDGLLAFNEQEHELFLPFSQPSPRGAQGLFLHFYRGPDTRWRFSLSEAFPVGDYPMRGLELCFLVGTWAEPFDKMADQLVLLAANDDRLDFDDVMLFSAKAKLAGRCELC